MSKSKFSGLLQPKEEKPKRPGKKQAPKPETTETREIVVVRRIGKRSMDNHTQVSAYIPKDTHKKIKAALIEDGRDFSELVSDLLAEWLDRA